MPRGVLPEVRASSEVYGEASVAGLAGIPIAGIAGAQQAALFGQQCTEAGLTKNTYGPGCFLLQNTGTRVPVSRPQLLAPVAWPPAPRPLSALQLQPDRQPQRRLPGVRGGC